MDEAAHERGVDPVAFRVGMLNAKGRNTGSAPELGRWRQAPGSGPPTRGAKGGLGRYHAEGYRSWHRHHIRPRARYAHMDGSITRVRVNRSNGVVTVEKLTLVLDAGTIVDPNGALAQVKVLRFGGSVRPVRGPSLSKVR